MQSNTLQLLDWLYIEIFFYILGRMGLFQRHDLHKFNVASVCRLVNEYNMMFAKVLFSKKIEKHSNGIFYSHF